MQYNIFASKYDSVTKMEKLKFHDEALDIKSISKICPISANSLEEAIEQYVETPEFNQFASRINGTVYVYYLNENGIPCHM